jgi:hypothetical protein
MIHRDVKPSNILLSAKGDVKLADFGLAKSSGGDSTLTGTGMFVGTPRYISPEQARGEEQIDFTADIYSLGCTIYHMLSGRAPFVADAPIAVVVQHLTKPVPSILEKVPDCPPAIVKVISRMTAKIPAKRPANYSELLEELRQAQVPLIKPRKKGVLRFALAGVAVMAGLSWYAETKFQPPPPPPPPKKVAVEPTPSPTSTPAPRDFAREIAALPAEAQAKRVIEKIKELNPDFDPTTANYAIENEAVTEFSLSIVAVTDISPISALVSLKHLRLGQNGQNGAIDSLKALSGLSLTGLECYNTTVSDLSPLHGMPLVELRCPGSHVRDLNPVKECHLQTLGINDTDITDLAPVRNMPLKFLNCGVTRVSDLSVLKGMPLTDLNCTRTYVRDLGPLTGMPLTKLICSHTFVEDLSPLRGMPLVELDCDYNPTRDEQILRSITTLEKINSVPAAEFWKNQ